MRLGHAAQIEAIYCRDDRCKLTELHPAHPMPPLKRGGRARAFCPSCGCKVKDRACTNCDWRG